MSDLVEPRETFENNYRKKCEQVDDRVEEQINLTLAGFLAASDDHFLQKDGAEHDGAGRRRGDQPGASA